MADKIETLLSLIMLGLFFILGFLVYPVYQDYKSTHISSRISSENIDCFNLSLEDTSYCLRDKLKGFYKYNISNIDADLSLEELKEQGGVCRHFADWYFEQLKSAPFYTKEVTFDISDENAHKITIVSSPNGYCILDQLSVKCFWLVNPSEEIK